MKTLIFVIYIFVSTTIGHAQVNLVKKLNLNSFVEDLWGDPVVKKTEIDFDSDSLDDILVCTTCGNSVCNCHIFLQTTSNKYLHLNGILPINFSDSSSNFEILRKNNRGMNDLLIYNHLGSDNYKLMRYAFDGSQYKEIATIKGGSELSKFIHTEFSD